MTTARGERKPPWYQSHVERWFATASILHEAFADLLREGTTCLREWRERLPKPLTPEEESAHIDSVLAETAKEQAEYEALLADSESDASTATAPSAEQVATPPETA